MYNKKIKVPTERDRRLYAEWYPSDDVNHSMDTDNYREASVLLSSDDYEQLHEAVLVTENFLSYNGSWDFQRLDHSSENHYICEIRFKWNYNLSMYTNITQKLKLPSGVNKEFRLTKTL